MSRPEGERILEMMRELESDVAYARGERTFEGEIEEGDAVQVAAGLASAIDEATALRSEKAREAGLRIACEAGCHDCCEQPILVWQPEALLVARFLERPENAAARRAFLDRYAAWKEAVGDGLDRMASLSEAEDWDAYARVHREVWSRRVLCAFNRDGLCTVYEARPVTCRHYHAVDTAAHCRVDDPSGTPPRFLTFAPVDQLVGRAKRLNSAMHHALGGGRLRLVALCTAVHELLTA